MRPTTGSFWEKSSGGRRSIFRSLEKKFRIQPFSQLRTGKNFFLGDPSILVFAKFPECPFVGATVG